MNSAINDVVLSDLSLPIVFDPEYKWTDEASEESHDPSESIASENAHHLTAMDHLLAEQSHPSSPEVRKEWNIPIWSHHEDNDDVLELRGNHFQYVAATKQFEVVRGRPIEFHFREGLISEKKEDFIDVQVFRADENLDDQTVLNCGLEAHRNKYLERSPFFLRAEKTSVARPDVINRIDDKGCPQIIIKNITHLETFQLVFVCLGSDAGNGGNEEPKRKWTICFRGEINGRPFTQRVNVQSFVRLNRPERLKGRHKRREKPYEKIKQECLDWKSEYVRLSKDLAELQALKETSMMSEEMIKTATEIIKHKINCF